MPRVLTGRSKTIRARPLRACARAAFPTGLVAIADIGAAHTVLACLVLARRTPTAFPFTRTALPEMPPQSASAPCATKSCSAGDPSSYVPHGLTTVPDTVNPDGFNSGNPSADHCTDNPQSSGRAPRLSLSKPARAFRVESTQISISRNASTMLAWRFSSRPSGEQYQNCNREDLALSDAHSSTTWHAVNSRPFPQVHAVPELDRFSPLVTLRRHVGRCRNKTSPITQTASTQRQGCSRSQRLLHMRTQGLCVRTGQIGFYASSAESVG
jgi:hypothetical protein